MNAAASFDAKPTSPGAVSATLAWVAVVAVLTCILFVLTRACDYDLGVVGRYGVYFLLHVVLPGLVVLAALHRGPISLTAALALGLPTGFAVEIFTFLACASTGLKAILPWLPFGWGLLAVVWSKTHAAPLVRWQLTRRHAGLALALSVAFLATVLAAASNMFLESPLADGLPQRPIFHDWVYLVSRAAAIKQHWPLEDPSLAGTPLQYHYFMLVHAASASFVTGAEITLVLLRLMIVPLGAIVVVQVYAIGRRVAGSPWAGVLAAFLVVATGELAFVQDPQRSVFVGRFIRWLYVSPTFYFGLIFFGAVVLALERWARLPRVRLADVAWLLLLGAAATGAKGTVMPIVIGALAAWALHEWHRQRRFPTRLTLAGVGLTGAFGIVYFTTMAGLRSGAAIAPFDVLQVADFWQQRFPAWQTWLAAALTPAAGAACATVACAAIVFAGTEGVRLLAIPWLLDRTTRSPTMSRWIGATFIVSVSLGLLLRMDADSELYVFLISRVPASILAAAFLFHAVARFRRWRVRPVAASPWRRHASSAVRWTAVAAVTAAVCAQSGVWVERNRGRFEEWMRVAPTAPGDDDLLRLEEALLWIRNHTEVDAVLIANTCTAANLRRDHWGAVDHTLAGVHYYYSAISERRMLIEGPLYVIDPVRAQRRTELASAVFYSRQWPKAEVLRSAPCYLILDRSVRDAAPIALVPAKRVFMNRRVEVYQLPHGDAALAAN